MSDADWAGIQPDVVKRFAQRDAEFWDQGAKMTKIQSPTGESHLGHQAEIGPEGVVRDVQQQAGDHDIYDIRKADGSPLDPADYDRITKAMEDAGMGVKHRPHMDPKWAPDPGTPEGQIRQFIIDKVNSGKEMLLRFEPGKTPTGITRK
ncbi:MAG: hypothetical protein E6I22_01025 [Chloroflexi bacterium]|nr:MAG: hypothetical protein E6I22_01025 [Chloroflexota bacterium]